MSLVRIIACDRSNGPCNVLDNDASASIPCPRCLDHHGDEDDPLPLTSFGRVEGPLYGAHSLPLSPWLPWPESAAEAPRRRSQAQQGTPLVRAGRHQPADACQCGCPQGLGVAGGLDVLCQVANLLGWTTSKPGRGGRCGAACAHRLLHPCEWCPCRSRMPSHLGHQQSSTASAMPSRTLISPKGTALKKALAPTPASERSPAGVAGLALASCMAQAAKSTRSERACCVLERAVSRVTVSLAGKLLLRACSVSTTAREASNSCSKGRVELCATS